MLLDQCDSLLTDLLHTRVSESDAVSLTNSLISVLSILNGLTPYDGFSDIYEDNHVVNYTVALLQLYLILAVVAYTS